MSNLPDRYEDDATGIIKASRAPLIVATISAFALAAFGQATVVALGGGLAESVFGSIPEIGTNPPATPTVTVASGDPRVNPGTSAAFNTSAFSGDGGDTHDSTISQVDTIDGDWSAPLWADSIGSGVNLITDTTGTVLDSAGVYKIRALHCGTAGGCSAFGDSTQFATGGGGGGGDHPNEPAGMTEVSTHPFDEKTPTGWGLNSPGNLTISDTFTTAPRSPPNVGRVKYAAGCCNGTSPITLFYNSGFDYQTVYVHFWAKWDVNWDGQNQGINKLVFIADASEGSSDPWYIFSTGAASNTMRVAVLQQSSSVGGCKFQYNQTNPCNGYDPNPVNADTASASEAAITRGSWHEYEFLIKLNTPGCTYGSDCDGTMEVWLGPAGGTGTMVQILNFSGLEAVGSGADGLADIVKFVPVYGGGGDTVGSEQYLWIDELYFSGM